MSELGKFGGSKRRRGRRGRQTPAPIPLAGGKPQPAKRVGSRLPVSGKDPARVTAYERRRMEQRGEL